MTAGSECARGHQHQTPRPQEQAVRAAGQSASSAPLIFSGRCGVSPQRRVTCRPRAGCMQGGNFLPALEMARKAMERAHEQGVVHMMLVDPRGLLPFAKINSYGRGCHD